MGYIRHDAIIVIDNGSGNDPAIVDAQRYALSLMPALVSPIVNSVVNGYRSFYVAPDGSKEGWAESDAGDEARSKLLLRLHEMRNAGRWLQWVAVEIASDDRSTRIVTDCWQTAGEDQ